MAGRKAEAQANEYANTLTGRLCMSLAILIIGGEVDPKLQDEYTSKKTSFTAYRTVIATARRQLDWLVEQLNRARHTHPHAVLNAEKTTSKEPRANRVGQWPVLTHFRTACSLDKPPIALVAGQCTELN